MPGTTRRVIVLTAWAVYVKPDLSTLVVDLELTGLPNVVGIDTVRIVIPRLKVPLIFKSRPHAPQPSQGRARGDDERPPSMVDRWRRSSRSKSPSTAQNLSASLVSGARCWGTSYRRHRRGLLLGTISIARCRLSIRVQRSHALIPQVWARDCSSSAFPMTSMDLETHERVLRVRPDLSERHQRDTADDRDNRDDQPVFRVQPAHPSTFTLSHVTPGTQAAEIPRTPCRPPGATWPLTRRARVPRGRARARRALEDRARPSHGGSVETDAPSRLHAHQREHAGKQDQQHDGEPRRGLRNLVWSAGPHHDDGPIIRRTFEITSAAFSRSATAAIRSPHDQKKCSPSQ